MTAGDRDRVVAELQSSPLEGDRHAHAIRRCASCRRPSVACIGVTEHRLNGIYIGRTYDHEWWVAIASACAAVSAIWLTLHVRFAANGARNPRTSS